MNVEEVLSDLQRLKVKYADGGSESCESTLDASSSRPVNFSSGLKFPNLQLEKQVEGLNKPVISIKSSFGKRRGRLNPNMKIRSVKRQVRSNPKSSVAVEENVGTVDVSTRTGLFNSSNAFYENDTSVNEDDDDTTVKIKTFIRKHKKSNKIDHEIQSRISKAYEKMETLEKGFKAVDNSIIAAKERATKSKDMKSPKFLSETFPSTSSLLQKWQARKRLQNPQGINENADTNPSTTTSTDDVHISSPRTSGVMEREIPILKDKSFLAKNSRRGTRIRKEINGIRTRLDVVNNIRNKSGHESKRGRTKTKSSFTFEENCPPQQIRKLLEYDPTTGPGRELTDFLQATGGLRGGWKREEHYNFLKQYIKFKTNPTKLIQQVSANCPERKVQEIASHFEWYEKYQQLNDANKKHIREWEIKKRQERQTIFQMAKEDQKAKIEQEKTHQEMLKFRREQEKLRQKHNLESWKKNLEKNVKLSQTTQKLEEIDSIAASLDHNDDTNEDKPAIEMKSQQLRQEMKATKERLVQLLPKTHDVRKVLSRVGTSSPTVRRTRQAQLTNKANIGDRIFAQATGTKAYMKPTSASLSSGIFSDYSEETQPREIFTFQHGLGRGDTAAFLPMSSKAENQINIFTGSGDAKISVKTSESKTIPAKSLIDKGLALAGTGRRGTNPSIVRMFQARDAELVEARKQAIKHKKEQQTNKANLSTEQIRERLNKIDVPSQIQSLTKGLKIRKSIKEIEAIESETRAAKRRDINELHKISRVSTPQMFKTDESIRNISKLRVPAWRNV